MSPEASSEMKGVECRCRMSVEFKERRHESPRKDARDLKKGGRNKRLMMSVMYRTSPLDAWRKECALIHWKRFPGLPSK